MITPANNESRFNTVRQGIRRIFPLFIEAIEMSAFLICDVVVKNTEKLRLYLKLSEHTLEPYGGKFHAQAGATEALEGDWNPKVIVIAEFPSMEKARQWYSSSAYAKALQVKPDAIERNMILTAGLKS